MPRFFGYLRTEPNPKSLPTCKPSRASDAEGSSGGAQPQQSMRTADCKAPRLLRVDGFVVGLAGEAIWRGDSIGDENEQRVLSDLVARYREKGPKLLHELQGAFALAVLHAGRGEGLVAIDRMGVEAITYAVHDEGVAFGASAGAVARHSGTVAIRDQALFDFLFLHMVPAPNTVYRGVMKLPLASFLHFKDGRGQVHRYWEPSYSYASRRQFVELKEGLRRSLETAVQATAPGSATGAFLSGGLDSSSVAGTFRTIAGEPIRTFTVGFGDSEHDELSFARTANRHFGNRAFEYQMRPADIVDAFPRIAAAYDEPFGNSSAAPTFMCAQLAVANGVTHILAGDGGDELFGGNERYTRHWIFEFYSHVPSWIRKGLLEPATRPISPESRIMPLRKARNYIDQAIIPLPDRFESWNYMYREGGEHMLHPDFADSIDADAPLAGLRELWNEAPSDNLLERMLWYDWQFTLADNDLRKVQTMCSLAGVRVSFPMLHPSVVELSTRVPPDMKIEGKELRSFFKKAMADFLPHEIIQKKKHGFALPFGDWMKTDKSLGDLFYSHMSDLKKRRIIAPDFIDNLIEQHRRGHPSYYGYAIWDLAMLEAWLVRHIDAA